MTAPSKKTHTLRVEAFDALSTDAVRFETAWEGR
jgi:hypothetical protein